MTATLSALLREVQPPPVELCQRGLHLRIPENIRISRNGRRLCLPCRREAARHLTSPASIAARRRTHCPQGHALDGDNLYLRRRGRRDCRTCIVTNERRRYHQRPEVRQRWLRSKDVPPGDVDWVVVHRLVTGDGYTGRRGRFRGPSAGEVLAAAARIDVTDSQAVATRLGVQQYKVTLARHWGSATGWVEPAEIAGLLPRRQH